MARAKDGTDDLGADGSSSFSPAAGKLWEIHCIGAEDNVKIEERYDVDDNGTIEVTQKTGEIPSGGGKIEGRLIELNENDEIRITDLTGSAGVGAAITGFEENA